ncbi:ovarian cancer G-protein coupled receptor 1-like [Plectropomus leopardus]|uniref:ovarian cancer G-protein coupled receptor 1-like n=1 Tax=Plectropomus leopardus TaxID=160734 RepID=UPI001C4D143E|nr:ovarian cancer G-protein coupled receptor 1-like [Plectropomus leopardus]
MENICNTSWNNSYYYSYDYSNVTYDYYSDNEKTGFIVFVVTCIIICICLPLTLMAIFALFSLVQNDHVAPIYVINLLISDLIQLCSTIFWLARPEDWQIYNIVYIYFFGVMASAFFMVCVALERYLVIVFPLWYRFRRTVKTSVLVCVMVWAIPLVYLLPSYFCINLKVTEVIAAILLLLPLPLFIFFLSGTLKALSASISVPSNEKRRIVGMLVLVLLIYAVLFLPSIMWSLVAGARSNNILSNLSFVFLRLSPLADLVLYIFMRKGTIDKVLASVCCCTMDDNGVSSPTT